jgi:hypothetical protein
MAIASNNVENTHRITPAELQGKRRDDFVNSHLHSTERNKNDHILSRGRGFETNTRTLLSFFSFGVSFGLPFFFTFGTADLDESGASDPSADVVVSPKAVVSSSFTVVSVCACA